MEQVDEAEELLGDDGKQEEQKVEWVISFKFQHLIIIPI